MASAAKQPRVTPMKVNLHIGKGLEANGCMDDLMRFEKRTELSFKSCLFAMAGANNPAIREQRF